jgi:hypothetical protein
MYDSTRTVARFEILIAVTIKFNVLRNAAVGFCKRIEVSKERAASVSCLISKKIGLVYIF